MNGNGNNRSDATMSGASSRGSAESYEYACP
jgi:hypothetical protein